MRAHVQILLLLTVFELSGQTDPAGSFRIHVVDAVTKKPVTGAEVVLDHERGQVSGATDSSGTFAGHSAAGNHLLTVWRTGYRPHETGFGRTVELKAGAEMEITVEMEALGVLTGRVLDQFGDPLRNAIVHTEDEVSVPGHGKFYQSYSAEFTDDRGEYRLANVPPGKHYIAVEYNSADEERAPRANPRLRWPHTGGLILYPAASDIAQAQQVDVKGGEMTRLNDIRLTIARSVIVTGRITPASDKAMANMERVPQLALHSSPLVQSGTADGGGNFKIEALPGTYVLTASDARTGRSSRHITLELADRNISNLVLELNSAYEVRGRFVVDGPGSIDFSKLLLNFGGPLVKIDALGAFTGTVSQGKGTYTLQQLPEGWYIKSVTVGGKPLIGTRQIEIEPGTADLVLTLSPRGARIDVSVEDGGSATQMVVLLPDDGPVPDVESMHEAQRGADGRFVVTSVPPGSYRVFALDVSKYLLVMNPAGLMEKYRMIATLISVSEGEQKKVIIPATKIPN